MSFCVFLDNRREMTENEWQEREMGNDMHQKVISQT